MEDIDSEAEASRTLEKVIAFNPAYRRLWRQYIEVDHRSQLVQSMKRLCEGLDEESIEICQTHLDLVRLCYPSPLLKQLWCRESIKTQALSPLALARLQAIISFGDKAVKLEELRVDLSLPEIPLDELLVDSGLRYIQDIAQSRIKGSVVIDAGAYIGDTAQMLLKSYAPSKIYAIEAHPRTFEILCRRIDELQIVDRVVPIPFRVGSDDSRQDLWGDGLGASVIRKDGRVSEPNSTEGITIDNLVLQKRIGNVGLIKLDIEGAELQAIRGAEHTIRKCKPILLISIYHAPADFFEIKPWLVSLGLCYSFMIRKVTSDIIKEIVLIGVPERIDD